MDEKERVILKMAEQILDLQRQINSLTDALGNAVVALDKLTDQVVKLHNRTK